MRKSYYELYLENPLMGWEARIDLETTNNSETVSVQYDSSWEDYFPSKTVGSTNGILLMPTQ